MASAAKNGGVDTSDLQPVRLLSPRYIAFVLPLILLHLGCGLVFLTGVTGPALAVFFVSSTIQIFGITVG